MVLVWYLYVVRPEQHCTGEGRGGGERGERGGGGRGRERGW